MRPVVILALAAWVVAIVVLFALFQFDGALRANPFVDYVLSAVKVGVLALAALSLGLAMLPQARLDLAGAVTRSALGFAALGIVALALAAVGLLRPVAVWPLVVALCVLSYRRLRGAMSRVRGLSLPGLGGPETLLAGLAALATLILLINCLAPLTANDALVYHFNLPKVYCEASGLASLPYNVYANMPHYGEMLFALAYCLGGETAAKLIYLGLVLGAALAVFALARMFTGRKPAMAGACLFLVQPLLLDDRTVGNVDLPLTYIFIAAVVVLIEALRTRPGLRSAAAAGLLGGVALGFKYTALATCIALLAVPLVAYPGRMRARALVVAALVAAAVFLPWAVKNQARVGNPCYPLLESTFDGANWDATQEAELLAWQRGMGPGKSAGDYLLLPLSVGLRGRPESGYARFDGILNPALVMLLPLALLKRNRETGALALMAAGIFVFWALTSQQMRFLTPCLALVAVLGAVGLARLAERAGTRAADSLIVAAVIVTALSLVVPDQRGRPLIAGAIGDRLGVVLGLEPRQQYLETSLQPVAMFEHINRTLPPGEPVLMAWENRGYYLDRPYVADSFFEASTIMRLVAGSADAADLAGRVRAMGFRYVLVNEWLGEHFSRSYGDRDLARLAEFVGTQASVVHSANRMTLYSINPSK
jgi:hypothetical protein